MAMKMKAYASFDDYLEDQSPGNQAIIRALRRFVKRTAPKLSEAVKWGNGCWVDEKEARGVPLLREGTTSSSVSSTALP
jgi:hypothetical protein